MSFSETTEVGYQPRIGRSVSLDQAAELLGVSRRTIYNCIRDGRLQTIRTIGGSQRVLLDSCRAFAGKSSDRSDCSDRSSLKNVEP
jgi:excisionase family DNA binding protein